MVHGVFVRPRPRSCRGRPRRSVFRLMFGNASPSRHVGRGLGLPVAADRARSYFADPQKFTGPAQDTTLAEYQKACRSFTHIALRGARGATFTPKVASRLAHWLVSLAMVQPPAPGRDPQPIIWFAGLRRAWVRAARRPRQRARGLVARQCRRASASEQDDAGRSTVTTSRLTPRRAGSARSGLPTFSWTKPPTRRARSTTRSSTRPNHPEPPLRPGDGIELIIHGEEPESEESTVDRPCSIPHCSFHVPDPEVGTRARSGDPGRAPRGTRSSWYPLDEYWARPLD